MNTENKRAEIKLLKKISSCLKDYEMILDNEKIVVGLSGGKDSLVLLDLLAKAKKKSTVNFELIAVHVRSSSIAYETRLEYIELFCTERNVPLLTREISIDFSTDKRKTPCFLCSTTRRKTLFDVAREIKASKVALGHHMNDAVETLLMNMMFNGSISAIPAKLSIFGGEIHIIRPLINIPENEISAYALAQNFQTQKKECPFSDKTQRKSVKTIIEQMQQIYPYSVQSIQTSMSRIFEEYLVQNPTKNKKR